MRDPREASIGKKFHQSLPDDTLPMEVLPPEASASGSPSSRQPSPQGDTDMRYCMDSLHLHTGESMACAGGSVSEVHSPLGCLSLGLRNAAVNSFAVCRPALAQARG